MALCRDSLSDDDDGCRDFARVSMPNFSLQATAVRDFESPFKSDSILKLGFDEDMTTRSSDDDMLSSDEPRVI